MIPGMVNLSGRSMTLASMPDSTMSRSLNMAYMRNSPLKLKFQNWGSLDERCHGLDARIRWTDGSPAVSASTFEQDVAQERNQIIPRQLVFTMRAMERRPSHRFA